MIRKINRQPTQTALDATDLIWLLDEWLNAQAAAVTGETVAGYRRKTDYFRTWWVKEGPVRHWQLTQKDLQRFEQHLRTRKAKQTGEILSWQTRHDALRRLRELFKWAYEQQYTEINHSAWVPAAAGGPNQRTAARPEQLQQLLVACTGSDQPARNAALLATLIGTGIRRSECSGLQIEDLIFHADGSGTMNVTGKRTRANANGKRQVAFNSITGAYLLPYVEERKQDSGPLFVAADGHALLSIGLYKIVKRMIRQAGLEKVMVGPHDLRRAFATHFAKQNPGETYADMLRRQLGHAHYSQTAQYTLLDADDLRPHMVTALQPRDATG